MIICTNAYLRSLRITCLSGLRGREKVEREFDEQIVINKYLAAIELVLER